MNKLSIISGALAALLSTSAIAADTTGYVLSAQSENYGISLGNGTASDFNEDADVLGINVNTLLDLKIELIDEEDENDYRLSVGKTFDMEFGPVGLSLTPEINYTSGDSYEDAEVRFAPVVTASLNLAGVSTYVEVGYDLVTVENALDDFYKSDGYYTLGVQVPVTDAVSVNAGYVQNVDADWNETDEELNIAINLAF